MAILCAGPVTRQITNRLFVNDWCLTGHNKMVQQTSWPAVYICIFVVKPHQCGLLINL